MKKTLLVSLLLFSAFFLLSPAEGQSQPLTPEQRNVMRRYQEAELARQDCQTVVRTGRGRTTKHRPSEGAYWDPFHFESFPEKFVTAINLYTALIEEAEKAFGSDHPQTAAFVNGLAMLYEEQGTRLDLAETLYRKALETRLKSFGPDNPEVADSLFDLGNFYYETGRYGEAEKLLQNCLDVRKKRLGNASPHVALALRAMGRLCEDLGDYAKAGELFNESLEIQKKSLGANHPEVARTLMFLAILSVKKGDIARCDRLANEALAIVSNPASGANSGERFIAGMWTTLPPLLKGEVRKAALSRMSTRRIKTAYGSGPLDFATIEKRDWAYYLKALNDDVYPTTILITRQFAANLDRGIRPELTEDLTAQTFGTQHPQMASAANNLAMFHIMKEDWDPAIRSSIRSNEINFAMVQSVFSMASESQKLRYTEKTELYRDILLSAVLGAKAEKENVSAALKWAMRMKGIVLDSMIGDREAIRKGLNPELSRTYGNLQQVRQELSSLYVKGPGADMDGFNARMAGLVKQKDDLEGRLSRGSVAFKESREMFSVTPDAVCSRMPKGSALIEYVELMNYAEEGHPPWLTAFVLEEGKCGSPVMVDLGPSAPIAAAIKAWREELRAFAAGKAKEEDARKRLDEKGKKVTALLWEPVAKKADLTGRSVVYISPDGPIHLMPFGALPVENGYLIERTNTAYVSTGKDFLRSRKTGTRSGALLVGGVHFDMNMPPQAQAASPAIRTRGQCGKLNELRWNSLPGTAAEVESIAGALAGKGVAHTVLQGDEARKSNVSARLSDVRYVHLATHGFFLGDECGANEGNRGIAVIHTGTGEGRPQAPLKKAPAYHNENPLLLSGLALAGANNVWKGGREGGDGDGYLLAMEVANLDLDGVELVTLSACETGLGEIKRGEGVFGLKRSFMIAGAGALVMSLWNVPDRETKDLMVNFYGRILSGTPGRDAFRESQLKMMKSGPAGSRWHPFYWAAFQYMGVN